MKKVLILLLVIISCKAFAQQDSLKAYNTNRIRITSNGMDVLGAWGLVNLGTGAWLNWGTGSKTVLVTDGQNLVPARVSTISPELKYFAQMNTIWGSVDFVTALLGYTGAQKDIRKNLSAAESLQRQNRIEKIFFVNGCLDVAYIGAGLYLKLAGDSRNSVMMRGYGESILMQGGFLLIFDGLMYKSEKANGSKLRNFLEKHPISFDGRRVGIIFNM
ncbi:MAG: hypothetical protein JSU01_16765 [Bacteroidetes bacterium]|nr:hypothetical protein [Bacteroidota bacterium]